MTKSKYNRIVKASAWYDLLVTFPFAFPILATNNLKFLENVHETLVFQGSFPIFEPLHLFFVNIFGSIVLVWSILRIRHTKPLYGLFDAFGRTALSSLMLFYLLVYGITPVVYFFFVPEILWGIIQYWGYFKYKENLDKLS